MRHLSWRLLVSVLAICGCSSPASTHSTTLQLPDAQAPVPSTTSKLPDAQAPFTSMIPLPTTMLPPFRMIGIIHNGQSLGVGAFGNPPQSTTQRYGNTQLHDASGQYTSDGGAWSTIPLVAPMRSDKNMNTGGGEQPYPLNIDGESPDVACADTIAALSGDAGYNILATNTGQAGASFTVIEKDGTGNAYQSALDEAKIATNLGIGYGVGISLLTHGETDAASPPGVYRAWLASYQAGLETDLKSLTGQSRNIPLVITQQNSNPPIGGGNNQSALEQVAAVQASPEIVFAGPKYYLPYYVDRAHLTATGYRILGEKYGQVSYQLLSSGAWPSFVPRSTTRNGNTVTVTFNVPILPLTWDATNTSPHLAGKYSAWAAGKGFEAWSGGYGGTVVTIESVTIQNDRVTIACTSTPDTIAYAHTPDLTTPGEDTGGFPDGRCGLLHDSDPFVGPVTRIAQPNWAPEFMVTGL